MATTKHYFDNILPQKFIDSGMGATVNDVFQFDIADAGTWNITSEGVSPGAHDAPDCVVTSDKETFDAILADSSLAMTKFMEGKITASNLGLAMQLQQFLG